MSMTVTIVETENFIFDLDPETKVWTCFRADDGAEVCEGTTLAGVMAQASAELNARNSS